MSPVKSKLTDVFIRIIILVERNMYEDLRAVKNTEEKTVAASYDMANVMISGSVRQPADSFLFPDIRMK